MSDNIQPLQGLNRLRLSDLTDEERKQWYKANAQALSKYSPLVRNQAAALIYKNQQFIKTFGREEFDKTAGVPGGAAYREQQLRDKVINDAWEQTFRAPLYAVKDPKTGEPLMVNNQPIILNRLKGNANVSNEWLQKYSRLDSQGKEEIIRAYLNGDFKTDLENSNSDLVNRMFNYLGKVTGFAVSETIAGLRGEEDTKEARKKRWDEATPSLPGGLGALDFSMEVPKMVSHAVNEYKTTKDQNFLDKVYDENTRRLANSDTVSQLKSQAYLDNNIVGATDEETKKIFYQIITPTDMDTVSDYENVNLGIPTYAAYFGNGSNVKSEVLDIGIDEMRQIIATKYAMEKAGIPKDQVRDMLEREAQKHVHDNESFLKSYAKFHNDMFIAAAAYTADKWNGLKNTLYMVEDAYDGGTTVWIDNFGNTIGEEDHPELLDNEELVKDKDGNSHLISYYKGKDGKMHEIHKEKISRSALLMMGREAGGKNAGGELDTWTNPAMWTKKEQYGVWTADEVKKWDKIGASPYAKAWDPDDTSHIMYDSFKMMSFGLADMALMAIPNGAGALAKGVTGASRLANGTRGVLNFVSKFGSATRGGQIAHNALASIGIGFAYARSNAYEQFSQNLSNLEETVRNKSAIDVKNRYDTDPEYREYIDKRRAELTEANINKVLAENAEDIESGRVVVNKELLQQQAAYQAYLQVEEEEIEKQIDINKETPEFRELQESAINTVAHTSNIMAVTDAMKYFAVGAYGHRRYLYENKAGLFGQTGKTVKEALSGSKNALKHITEVKNAEGKLRLSTQIGKDFAETRKAAKQWGKVARQLFVGGAWTNGTDDMQVDGVLQINEDAMDQMYNAYLAGEPISDTYGMLEKYSSFMTGMGRSLGQRTTWDVTLIGGLGSTISGNLNFANIASMATKKGRQQFREQYGTRVKRNSEGEIEYKDEVVLDEDGNELRDEEGKVVTRKVPKTENVRWYNNFWERANFFVQNGVLNTFYGNRQEAFQKVDRVQAANNMLDEVGDFIDLEDYITASGVEENVTTERERLTSRFVRALRLARSLAQVGKTVEGKLDTGDPMLASSLYQKAMDLINKANSMEIYDTGVNVGEFTPEETENILREWYSKNPQEVRSEANDIKALRSIAENAKEITEAIDAYDEAVEHIAKSEAKSDATFSTHVKNKMAEDYALLKHWQKRYDKLRKETGDTSSPDRELSYKEFIASVGGIDNAEQLITVYDTMIDDTLKFDKEESDEKVLAAEEALNKARNKFKNAKTIDERETARKEVNKAYAKYDEALARQEQIDEIISRMEANRREAIDAVQYSRSNYASELTSLNHLESSEKSEAIGIARNIPNIQSQIEEQLTRRKNLKQQSTPKIDKEIKRLQKLEQENRAWLKEKLHMNDAQVQQFIEEVAQTNITSSRDMVLTALQIMDLDPVTRSKMLDTENKRLYSEEQLREIDKLRNQLNMRDPGIEEKLHDIARLSQQINRVTDAYEKLSKHPEGASQAIEADRILAADAAYRLLDRKFALQIADFIDMYDDKIVVNSTDIDNDLMSAVQKYHDRILNMAGLIRFFQAKAQAYEQAIQQGKKPEITQRDKDNAIFELLRTLNSRILTILDEEQLIENHRTELDKARKWVDVIENISTSIRQSILDERKLREFGEYIFDLTFFCEDEEDIMRQLEYEANDPSKPEFTADLLNLLDDLEEQGHLRNAVIYAKNAEKYKDLFEQKGKAFVEKNKETANKAFSVESSTDLDEFCNNLSESARKALEAILTNSKTRKLNELGTRYIINGDPYARVTSIKALLRGPKISKFGENNPWALSSTCIGNSLDEFGRDVFNGIYDNMSEEERLEAFKTRYSNSTPENYEAVFQKLKDFQRRLKENNQRVIRLGTSIEDQGSAVAAGTVTVVMPDGTKKEIRVAGSLDVIAMDNQGNLHIYDFKTHRSALFTLTDATQKGYDRQLSMYARLLEREYGLRVASINIIPVRVNYTAPKGANVFNKTYAEYKKENPNSNQLSIKEKGSSSYREFREANFKVEDVIPLVRLGEDSLIIDYDKLNKEDRKQIDILLAEQDTNPSQPANAEEPITPPAPIAEPEALPQRNSPSVTEIHNSITTEGGRIKHGRYIVEADNEGSVHINFANGDTKARRSISLDEIGVSKRDAFGSKEVNTPTNEQMPILNATIDVDGNVTIMTFDGPIFGNVARKILDTAFPEMSDYMEQFPKPIDVQNNDIDNGNKGTIAQQPGTEGSQTVAKIDDIATKVDDVFSDPRKDKPGLIYSTSGSGSTMTYSFTKTRENKTRGGLRLNLSLDDLRSVINEEIPNGVTYYEIKTISIDNGRQSVAIQYFTESGQSAHITGLIPISINVFDLISKDQSAPWETTKLPETPSQPQVPATPVTPEKDFSNPDDHFLMFVTYNGWDRKGNLKDWSRPSTPDIRTWPDGWGKHNDVFYYKKSIPGRSGDNITIWFKESPTSALRKQIELLLDSGENNSDVVKKQILDILSGKQKSPANEHVLDDATINDFTNIAGHINALIQNIPDNVRGKKQLNRGVSDLQEALKTKDAIKIANALEKFVNNTHRMDQTDLTKGVQDLVNYILDKLKVAGYEVNYRIGERYNAGDRVIVTFSEDESLPIGDQIIDSATKPAITKNGVLIQKATVNVRQNMPYEFEAANAIEHYVRKIPKDHRAKTVLTNRAKELTQAIRDKKDPVTILNILNKIMVAASKMAKEGATKVFADPILKNANEIYEIFQHEGYEIVDVIGQEYNDGMPFEALFVPDDTLEPGQRIITGVSQPQIDKDGVMVQAPKITVRQNLAKDSARNTGEPEALSQRILIRSSVERNGEETGDHVAFGEKGSDLHRKSLDPRTIARANDRDKHKVGNDVYLVENANGTTTIARGPVGGRGGAYGVVIWRRLTSVEKDRIVSLLEKDIPAVDADASLAQEIDDILHGKSRTLLTVPSYASPRSWESSQRGAAERMYHGTKILTGEWLQTDLMLFKLAQDAGIIKNISLIEINPDNHALAITESDWEEAVEQLQKLGINSPRELAEIKPDTFDKKARRKAVVQAEKQNAAKKELENINHEFVEHLTRLSKLWWAIQDKNKEEENNSTINDTVTVEFENKLRAINTTFSRKREDIIQDIKKVFHQLDADKYFDNLNSFNITIEQIIESISKMNELSLREKQLKEQLGEDLQQEVQQRDIPQVMDDAAIREELSNLENKQDSDSVERSDALKKEQQRRKEIQDKYSVGTQVESSLLGIGVVTSHQEENGLKQMTVDYDETGERTYYFLENELPTPTGVKIDLTEEEDNINLHDNGTDVWVETSEGNSQEAHDSSNFDESINENGTLEDNNSDPSDNSPAVNQQSNQDTDNQDTRILPLSGNSLPVYWNTETSPLAIKGTLVTQVERKEQETRAKNRPINENDTIHTFNALLNSLGIKLDDIITEELAPIFIERPDTPIKFMAVNYVTENSPGDARLNDVCFLVIDYDDNVRRIHSDGKNGRKDNGGIITAQNKQYLIIGTMGYGDYRTVDGSRKRTLWNAMFGRDSKIGTGFFKLATGKFFQNPENNGERFYVIKNNDGEFYSTELKKGSITPGWFVKLPNGQKQPLGKLINSNDREINPFRLRWDTIGFGIAEYTQFWSTMDNRAVMEVSDKEKNAGNTYVLIPAGNGKYAPAAIRPTRYAEKRDSSSGEDEIIPNSPLDQRINKLLDKLTARTYKERVQAIKELYKYLYLSNGGGINETNFWLDKKENIIKIVKSGKVVKEFSLDASNFDRQEFKDYVKQEMRPRINITPATLTDMELLQEYDESGALLVDLAKLRTAGSNFEIWPIGADNKILKPEKPISQHPEESYRIKGTQIPYMGQYYIKDTNDVYWDQSGVEVIDDAVIEDLEINKRINDSRLQPEKLTSNKATYILDQSTDNPLVVDVDRSTYKVTKYKTEDAIKFIQEVIEKREQEERDRAAQDALGEDAHDSTDTINPPKPETSGQSREQELKELEESSYQATFDSAKNLSNEDIQFLINKDIEMLDDNQVTVLDEESKALLNGELRAYYDELERREQHPDNKPSEIKSIDHTGINQAPGSVGTITFLELISDKRNLGRFMEALKTFEKLSKAPKDKPALIEYLRSNKINVDSIDNTKEGIDAWFETIRCRFGL